MLLCTILKDVITLIITMVTSPPCLDSSLDIFVFDHGSLYGTFGCMSAATLLWVQESTLINSVTPDMNL